MVICVHEAQHAAQIHRSVTTYSVQDSISDTLLVCPGKGYGPEKAQLCRRDAQEIDSVTNYCSMKKDGYLKRQRVFSHEHENQERTEPYEVWECDAAPQEKSIRERIEEARSAQFRERLADLVNPYGEGRAAEKIVQVLTTTPLSAELLVKRSGD